MKFSRAALIILICLASVMVAVFIFVFTGKIRLVTMTSRSMESSINTKTNVMIHQGDTALVTTFFVYPLHRGNLVLVNLQFNEKVVETIRRVAALPGDQIPKLEMTNPTNNITIPDGYYYLIGDSTNAIDSRQLGLISKDKIVGRVISVYSP